jgi:nitrous oxidase accessory protein
MASTFISIWVLLFALAGTAGASEILVAGDLQAAIAGASPGDTLIVPSGVYQPFTVDRPLTILGEGRPSVRAKTQNPAITIRGHGVQILGFQVDGVPKNQEDKFRFYMDLSSRKPQYSLNQPNSGILVDGNDVLLEDMIVNGSEAGILVKYARNFTILNSSIQRCDIGLLIQEGSGGRVAGSTFQDCKKYGASIEASSGFSLERNQVIANPGAGIMLKDSTGCTLRGNSFIENWQGLFLWNSSFCDLMENEADRNVYYGMVVASGSNNSILNNEARKTGGGGYGFQGIGISIQENSTYNLVAGNVLSENLNGLDLTRGCKFNLIFSNEIYENSNGIRLDKNENNLVYKNNFRRNLITGYDNASHNFWNGSVGNYYDDYRGRDRDGDGVGDDPYWIPKGSSCVVDWRPLMTPADGIVDIEEARLDLARYATYNPEDDLPYRMENDTIVIRKKEPGKTEPAKWWA